MSAYNRLLLGETCPRCGSPITRGVQFKYGDVWQRDYSVGNSVTWDRNNVGQPGQMRVMVSGHPESCPVCDDVPDWTYDLVIVDDVIYSTSRRDPGTEFERYGHEPFVVLQDIDA